MDLPRATQQEKEEQTSEHKASCFKQKETPPYTQCEDLALLQQAVTSWSRLAAFVLPSATLQLAFPGRL